MSDEQPTPSISPGDNWHYLVNVVYYKWIIEHVKFSEVISKMPFMRKIAGQIYSLDGAGKATEASEFFLAELKKSNDCGKYTTLLQALEDSGYTFLVSAIKKGIVNENHEEHKKILDIFMRPLLEQIDPSLMANILYEQEVLSHHDLKNIMQTSSTKSIQWAAFELLDLIPRKNANWYTIFWDLLYEQGHTRLCEEIDPKLYSLKTSEHPSEEEHVENPPLPFESDSISSLFSSNGTAALVENNPSISSDSGASLDPSLHECHCSCIDDLNKKVEELKAFYETKLNDLELKVNEQSQLLEKLLNK